MKCLVWNWMSASNCSRNLINPNTSVRICLITWIRSRLFLWERTSIYLLPRTLFLPLEKKWKWRNSCGLKIYPPFRKWSWNSRNFIVSLSAVARAARDMSWLISHCLNNRCLIKHLAPPLPLRPSSYLICSCSLFVFRSTSFRPLRATPRSLASAMASAMASSRGFCF